MDTDNNRMDDQEVLREVEQQEVLGEILGDDALLQKFKDLDTSVHAMAARTNSQQDLTQQLFVLVQDSNAKMTDMYAELKNIKLELAQKRQGSLLCFLPPKKNMMTEDHTSTIKISGLEAIWYSTKQAGHHQDLRELFLNWFSKDFLCEIPS
jgi:hypothetical protein